MVGEGLSRRLGIRAAAADGGDAAVRLDNVSLAAEQEGLVLVADQQQSFQVPQVLVGAPILGQFHGGAANVAVVLLQLGFKAAEEGKGVGSRAGKAGQNLVAIEAANLAGSMFDYAFAQCNLTVSCHHHVPIPAHTQNGSRAYKSGLFHAANSSL